ncbi:respiratory growth induced protein 1 [Hyphopichia burtonii NRRL Y-1933]|uniref:Respiratory growth induced protein 1 n=1 Tax=Hyphopichia burtonii NRRL Y-1933 TaxID=984485 RepID=A0A1E4RM51_9ASCO|nr:respiratory growth induced protein 1 [Hyphopichia burtonii NRRL Y-1933]ODV68342.1 respiratory growth induced protein 1 [Hyphopichia burtonii NRRL Y-1933]
MVKKTKSKSQGIPLDLDNCETLEHLKPIPKSRSSSITSIESDDGSISSVLKPPPRREFEELTAFESYIRDETWDNDFDYCHAHLSYYPPFILKEVHNNLDKIKPTMNKNSRKFRRRLQSHIKRHLMIEMEKCSGFKMDFDKVGIEETPTSVVYKFADNGDHGFDPDEEDLFGRHWKLELEVKCNNENPLVEVDYKAIPIGV